MLEVKNLVKKYGSKQVLNSISFDIGSGLTYGFLGRNGAGKTTTMNILAGIINYNSGSIIFDGIDLKHNKHDILQHVGYVSQNPVFYDYMTSVEYLNFIAKLTGYDSKLINKRIDEVLQFAGLADEKNKRIKAYSGGMRQRFAIAVAIFNKPKLLILDEPTSSLDPEGRTDVLNFINTLKSDGTTVFLSSHILNDIERVCQEVSIIDNGNLLVSENLNELKNKYILPIFDIESTADFGGITPDIAALENVLQTNLNGNILSVFCDNATDASSKLLKIIAEKHFPIVAFNQRKSNLDDIFMRLVNENV